MVFETPKTPNEFSFIERVLTLTEERVRYLGKITIIDRFLAKTVLPFLPKKIKPNHITLFRFASIPFIIILLLTGNYTAGAVIFSLAALSDALDGALARTTKHVTVWGILADPLADKLLVGSASLLLIWKFLGHTLAFLIVFIEIITIFSAYHRYKGKAVPAKTSGKIKMVLQCGGIIFLFLFTLTANPIFLFTALYTLYAAVAFALLSLLVYKSV